MKNPEPTFNDYSIYNCHVHLFNIDHIPANFLNGLITTKAAKRIATQKNTAKALLKLFKGQLNRYSAFLYSALNKPEDIFEELQAYYPRDTKFVPLSVDFDYMEAGKPIRPYLQQLEDLAALRDKFPDKLFPFVGADPRRPDVTGLVKEYIENKGFSGIKMYPSLGFFPDDERLDGVYAFAEANEIPLTTHCIPKNANYYRGKISDADYAKASQIPGYSKSEERKNYDFVQYYNHPHGWQRVLNKFPGLKLNLAHFGGNVEWDKYLDDPFVKREKAEQNWFYQIRKMIENEAWPNVYADISFTVFDDRLYPLLKAMIGYEKTRDYILFGSDFFMLQKDYRERRFGFDMRGYLSDDFYWQIAYHNPRRFLYNKLHGEV